MATHPPGWLCPRYHRRESQRKFGALTLLAAAEAAAEDESVRTPPSAQDLRCQHWIVRDFRHDSASEETGTPKNILGGREKAFGCRGAQIVRECTPMMSELCYLMSQFAAIWPIANRHSGKGKTSCTHPASRLLALHHPHWRQTDLRARLGPEQPPVCSKLPAAVLRRPGSIPRH